MTSMPALQSESIKHCMFIDLEVNGVTYYLSNAYAPITWQGRTYTQLGHFMGISEMQNDLKVTNQSLTVTLSGLPPDDDSPNYMSIALNSNLKGSKIIIYRAFFDITSGNFDATAVYQRFNGYVSNYSLSESWDADAGTASNTIGIQCASIHAIMEKKYSGRRTNNTDEQYWYPGDTGMFRVKALADTQFDFGKPYNK